MSNYSELKYTCFEAFDFHWYSYCGNWFRQGAVSVRVIVWREQIQVMVLLLVHFQAAFHERPQLGGRRIVRPVNVGLIQKVGVAIHLNE